MKLVLALVIIAIALVGVSMIPVRQTENAPFASPAFQRVWNSELASAARSLDLWGGEPLVSRTEPYSGQPGNRRTVQYFERGRMELGAEPGAVSLGLLAYELTTGRIDLGPGVFEHRESPEISIDGGELIDQVPTYLTLSRLVGERASDRSVRSERVVDWVDRSGLVENGAAPTVVRYSRYIGQTGHNLPDVTDELFQQSEFSGDRWIESFGFPISEPFWSYYRRNDTLQPALVQVFERRLLIYTPQMEFDKRFTVANSGRHYYRWRYGHDLTVARTALDQEQFSTTISLPDDYNGIDYPIDIGTPIDLTLSPSGHLMVLTQQGQILHANSLDPDGIPDGFSIWVDGIEQPRGITTKGNRVLVSSEQGVHAFRDQDGSGVPDQVEDLELPSDTLPVEGAAGKLIVDHDGHIYSVAENGSEGSSLIALDSSPQPVLLVGELLEDLGPLLFSDGHLFAAGAADDGRSRVIRLPGINAGQADQPEQTVVTFPPETIVHALEVTEETTWPIRGLGSLLVAAEGTDGGSIYLLAMDRPNGASELIEFARGLSRPVAMVFGLDGSLYVADAGLGRVVRIVHVD